MTTDCFPEPIAAANTPEWLVARRHGIGASEAAAACGVSEYRTPLDVWAAKRGDVPPLEQTDAMRLGHLLEPVVESEFVRRTGLQIERSPVGLLRHASEHFVLATPDAVLLADGGLELGEWKTTTWRQAAKLGEEDSDDVPVDWLCQVQQQMAVTGLAVANLAVLIDGRTLRTYRVERDEDLITAILEAESELWQRVVDNDPPEPNWEHPRTPKLIAELYRGVDGEVVELSCMASHAWRAYESLGQEIRKLQKERDGHKALVMYELGDHAAGILDDGERTIRRKQIEAKEITYTRGAYVDVRAVKIPTKARSK